MGNVKNQNAPINVDDSIGGGDASVGESSGEGHGDGLSFPNLLKIYIQPANLKAHVAKPIICSYVFRTWLRVEW